MKTFLIGAAAGAVLSATSMAVAEPAIDATVTLGYSFGELGVAGLNADVDAVSLQFASTIRPSDNFEFDLDLDLRGLELDNTPGEAQVGAFAIEPRYTLPNGVVLLGFYEYSNVNISPSILLGGFEPQTDTYGVGVGYGGDNWEVEAFISQADVDPVTAFISCVSLSTPA